MLSVTGLPRITALSPPPEYRRSPSPEQPPCTQESDQQIVQQINNQIQRSSRQLRLLLQRPIEQSDPTKTPASGAFQILKQGKIRSLSEVILNHCNTAVEIGLPRAKDDTDLYKKDIRLRSMLCQRLTQITSESIKGGYSHEVACSLDLSSQVAAKIRDAIEETLFQQSYRDFPIRLLFNIISQEQNIISNRTISEEEIKKTIYKELEKHKNRLFILSEPIDLEEIPCWVKENLNVLKATIIDPLLQREVKYCLENPQRDYDPILRRWTYLFLKHFQRDNTKNLSADRLVSKTINLLCLQDHKKEFLNFIKLVQTRNTLQKAFVSALEESMQGENTPDFINQASDLYLKKMNRLLVI